MTTATVAHSARRKLLWVFLPWFGGMVLFGVGFAALAYAFVIEEGRFTVPKKYLFWGGFVAVAAYGLFVLRPRIRLLELGEKEGQGWRGMYYMVAGVGIVISMWLCLEYAASAFGSITPLRRMADGPQALESQFYELPGHEFDSSAVVAFETLTVGSSGRGQRHWDAGYYLAMPILDAARDGADSICHAWLCKVFDEQFPYSLDYDMEPQIARFQRDSRARFQAHAQGRLLVFEHVTDDGEAWWFESAIEKSHRYKPGPHLLLKGLTDTLSRQNTKAMVEILALWFFGGVAILGMVMLPLWDHDALQRFLAKRQNKA